MPMTEASFDSEQELQDWVYANIDSFLPSCYLVPGFQITTISGKNGVSDGFAFNLDAREWYVIECELLRHGVWPHIAEQITRFVVALQNPDTLRKIRERLFEYVLGEEHMDSAAASLDTTPALRYIREYGVTHVVFVMADPGFVKVPMPVIDEFLEHTNTSSNPDGTVRHYHCLISPGPEPELFWSNDRPKYPLAEHFQPFD